MTPEDLRRYLTRRGLSQAALAKLLSTSQQNVNHWATGQRRIPSWVPRMLELLALEAQSKQKGISARAEGSDFNR